MLVHHSRLEAADAEALNVPHICLASLDEPVEEVARVKEILSKPGKIGYVETYGRPMFHGWMGKFEPRRSPLPLGVSSGVTMAPYTL